MRCLGRAIAKKATVALLLLWGGFSFAGITDYVATFSTPGPDRYADGTVVADGECYALEALPDSPEVKRTKERVDAELKKGLSPDK